MSTDKALSKLESSLREAIDDWVKDPREAKEWEELDTWVGERLTEHMASAAIAVLSAAVDVQRFMEDA